MPGIKNILMGAGFVALGLLITGATYAIAPGGHFVVAYGAVLVGGFQLIVGLGQAALYNLQGAEGRAKHHARIGMRVILRSMVSMSAADGQLEEGEIIIIQMVTNVLFGGIIDEQTIRDTHQKMLDDGSDVFEELADLASQVTSEDAELAVKAITMVAHADGEVSEEERQRLGTYASALRVDGDRLSNCIAEAKSTIEQLIAAQNTQVDQPAESTPAYG